MLGQHEKRVLMLDLVMNCRSLCERLEFELMDLDVMDYFDEYYRDLYKLVYRMKLRYPIVDMSTKDIDLLYKRKHMLVN